MYARAEGEHRGYDPRNEVSKDLRPQAFGNWLTTQGIIIPSPDRIANIPIRELPRYELDVPVGFLQHNVPVDRAHVDRLKDQLSSSGYQWSSLTVGYHDGQPDVTDGFHRSTAIYELGQEEIELGVEDPRWGTARCGVVFCTTEQFLDARIVSAATHGEVKLARADAWIREAYGLTPWADKIDVISAFQLHRSVRGSRVDEWAAAKDFSVDETQQLLNWGKQKSKIWGLSTRQIELMLRLTEKASPNIVPLVRETLAPAQPSITRPMLSTIVEAIPDHRLQEAVTRKIIAEKLDNDEARALVSRLTEAETPTRKSFVLSTAWSDLRKIPSRTTQAEKEAAKMREEEQDIEGLRQSTENLRIRIQRTPFDRHPDLRRIYTQTLLRTYATLTQFLAQESVRRPIRELVFEEGQTIFEEGEPANIVYLVKDGVVRLFNQLEEGKKVATLILKAPAIIGEEAFLTETPRSGSADALSPATLMGVHKDELDNIVSYHPELAKDIIVLLSQRMQVLMNHQAEVRQNNSSAVLAKRLTELQEIFGEAGIPLSQFELADYAGITRQTIGRIYQQWREQHFVAANRNRTYILDPDALEEMAKF